MSSVPKKDNSTPLQQIRGARTVTELQAITDKVKHSIQSISTDIANVAIAPNSVKIRASLSQIGSSIEIGGSAPRRPARTAQQGSTPSAYDDVLDLEGVQLGTAAGRAKAAKQLAMVSQSITELKAAYQVLRSPVFSRTKTATAAASAILETIQEAETLVTKLGAIAKAARNEVPAQHANTAASIRAYLKKIIPADQVGDISLRHYVAGATGRMINYQSYIVLKSFTGEDGYVYPNYTIVVTSSVDTGTGKAQFYLTSMPEIKAPGSFPFGSEFTTKNQLKSAINRNMAIDSAAVFGDRRPVNHTTEQLRARTALGLKTHKIGSSDMQLIDGVRVQNNKIYVRLVNGMNARERTAATNEVTAIISSMYGSSMGGRVGQKSAVTYKPIVGAGGREWLEYTLLPSRGSQQGSLTLNKINQVATALNLTAEQTRALKSAIKQ